MKYTVAVAASLAAGAAAKAHVGHHRFHERRSSPVLQARDKPSVVVEYIAGPTETVYQLEDKLVDSKKAKAGLDNGDYVIVGESMPTYIPPPPPPEPTTTSVEEPKADMGAQFIEEKTEEAKPTYAAPPPPKKSSPPSGEGLDSEFPSGKVSCKEFPSAWGAVPVEWLRLGGWSGLQQVPNYKPGDLSIDRIDTGIEGDNCKPGTMCSYDCPAGYQKSQYPEAQGATKQSIGGLFCNKEGLLIVTNTAFKTLCIKGAGGVSIQNDLDDEVSTCRTDYPGTENMVLATTVKGGDSKEICNPKASFYIWDNSPTTAQYYVNQKGVTADQACIWGKEGDDRGNFSPVNIGVGEDKNGDTWAAVFNNDPSTRSKLKFNIDIMRDDEVICSLFNGTYKGTGAHNGGKNDGCTVGAKKGQKIVFRYYS